MIKRGRDAITITQVYEHVKEGVIENEEVEVLWDINVQCDNVIEARRPDIIGIDKKERKGIIINIPATADVRKGGKEGGKSQDLKRETGGLWILKMVEVMPVVIGAEQKDESREVSK